MYAVILTNRGAVEMVGLYSTTTAAEAAAAAALATTAGSEVLVLTTFSVHR